MASYWVRDAEGRVLGPLTLEALRPLANGGRLSNVKSASLDGQAWVPLAKVPEVEALFIPPAILMRREADQQEAQRIELELDRIQELATHVIFGVPEDADLRTYRKGFITVGKQYHPARLPMSAHPDLLRATMAIFQLLSTRMAIVEKKLQGTAPPPAAATRTSSPGIKVPVSPGTSSPRVPVPQAAAAARTSSPAIKVPVPPGTSSPRVPVPQAAAAAPKPAPTYAPHEFVGFSRRVDNRLEVSLKVPLSSVGIFIDHKLVNLSSGGLYVPLEQTISLGTRLGLTLTFEEPAWEIQVDATVVLENAATNPGGLSGIGLRLGRLADGDRMFLEDFVRRGRAQRAAPR